ncbi:hypothetical protein [Kamptonema formosum]|uniref:hypothetical protein n=1 Tax=Kamptonema formosum TaxID=331992 RepID=UPI00034D2478|nr:hypothetical protein [Oscillatoria sp. PCC 10802]
MESRIKIGLAPARKGEIAEQPKRLPLSAQGAGAVLGAGAGNFPGNLAGDFAGNFAPVAVPLQPSATTMFGPRGALLVRETGPLWVSDTGHHRLLGWRHRPTTDGQPADWVIGQPDFNCEGQNAKGTPGRATLSVPAGICACGEGLAVADAWNHRVLIWKQLPEDSNVPADLVLGQADFTQTEPNRGSQEAAANSTHWPYGVFYHRGRLFVADTGNRRVLVWHQLPESNGQPADLVLGQPDMTSRNENGGGTPNASSMRWPHSIAFWGENLAVSDAGNNRVTVWEGMPAENNAPCSVVLGQLNFNLVELNQGVYWPSAGSLNMPYGVAAAGEWLVVADTGNSRLLGWRNVSAGAEALAGQLDFQSKGENRSFGMPARDSLCWPYGIQFSGKTAVIADSGNNRILLWDWEV